MFLQLTIIETNNNNWVCLKMSCTPKPNGFADHYPGYFIGGIPYFQTNPIETAYLLRTAYAFLRRMWFAFSARGSPVSFCIKPMVVLTRLR